ncbi:MAG: DNA polymerase Y family protein [Armatimonadetes bacterium]|nr:DNA polymerase Y family protein [Armatimonadota bacterium]
MPCLLLQILCARHRDWRGCPLAVIASDRPTARILQLNRAARRSGLRPGMQFSVALGLEPTLRAAPVETEALERVRAQILTILHRFSPEVESWESSPEVFWLNAEGLGKIYLSAGIWGRAVLAALPWRAAMVIGYSRFATLALSRARPGLTGVSTPQEERASLRRVRLSHLDLEFRLLEQLEHLGIRTVGDFLQLPAGGLRDRFGPEALKLYRLASGDLWDPLLPDPEPEPVEALRVLDYPEHLSERLLFLLKGMLHPLLGELHRRGEALCRIVMKLSLEGGEQRSESLGLAEPTLEALPILDLIRLRLEGIRLDSGVQELGLQAVGAPAPREQLELFAQASRREMAAANRALARLRAELGEERVVQAIPEQGHLPGARFRWESMERLERPSPRATGELRPMVRRYRNRAQPLQELPPGRFWGPFRHSGDGWRRDYYYLHTGSGELLWIYYDAVRKRWFGGGTVE